MNLGRPKVLIIEDELDILKLLKTNLEREGFQVITVRDGESGLTEVISRQPNLILLDLMLPKMNGIEACRLIRQKAETRSIPIIMLTAKGEESDKVLGLAMGADDYVTKPFSIKELIARIRAVLRRLGQSEEEAIESCVEVGPLVIDPLKHQVRLHDKPLSFTVAEFRLLKTLASRPGRVFTREQLLEKITGGEAVVIDRNVDVHIGAIRKKLYKKVSVTFLYSPRWYRKVTDTFLYSIC